MKRQLSYMLLPIVALTAASCREDIASASAESVCVSFVIGGTRAGADPPGFETAVLSLDVLAFDTSGGYAVTGGHSDGGPVTVSVARGSTLTFHVVANAPEGAFDGCTTRSAYLSALSRLEDSTAASMVMASEGETRTFTGETVVPVSLTRLCSKVVLESLTPALAGSGEAAEVSLDSVYLINVAGSCPYSMAPSAAGPWYNAMGRDGSLTGTLKGCLVKDAIQTLTSSSKVGLGFVFYCCPNPTDNDVSSATASIWSPRNTRLVLEFTLDGEKNYYPIDIPAMRCDRCYTIRNLTITRKGSHHPDIPVSDETAQFSVDVTPWGTNDITDVELN